MSLKARIEIVMFILVTVSVFGASPFKASVLKPNLSYGTDGEIYHALELTPTNSIKAADGKLLLTGYSTDLNYMRVVRLNADGTMDNSFATMGVYTALGPPYAAGEKIKILNDGKIGVVGTVYGSHSDIRYWRLNSDGTVDTTLNGAGYITFNYSGSSYEYSSDFAVDTSGNIFLLGQTTPPPPSFSQNNVVVMKYNSSGVIDSTFGTGGVFHYAVGPLNHYYQTRGIVLANDGKIYALTSYDTETTNPQLTILRINADGTLDNTYGVNGNFTSVEDYSNIYLHLDGEDIYLASNDTSDSTKVYIDKYNLSGNMDLAFGVNGRASLPQITEPNTIREVSGVRLDEDDRIFVTGNIYNYDTSAYKAYVCALDINGEMITNFGVNGCYENENGLLYPKYISAYTNGELTYFLGYDDDTQNTFISQFRYFYQIDFGANPHSFTAKSNNLSVLQGTSEGLIGENMVSISLGSNPLASVFADFTADLDWSSLTGEVDIAAGKSFVHGLTSLPGVAGTYTLYVPKTSGSNAVHICPGATNLAAVSASCSGGVSYQNGSAGVTVENIAGQDFWTIPNMTSTGGMSFASTAAPTLPDTGMNIEELVYVAISFMMGGLFFLKQSLNESSILHFHNHETIQDARVKRS